MTFSSYEKCSKVLGQLGLGDISNAMIMCISSVKPVPWLAVNLHHLLSNGAAFNTPSRRSLTSYAISLSISQMNREFTDEMCITITFDISPSPNLDMFFMSFAHQDLLKVATVFTSNEEVTVDVMETQGASPGNTYLSLLLSTATV